MHFSTRLARLLKANKPAMGMGNDLADPAVLEVAALAGYDRTLTDMEHNPFTESQVAAHILAAGGYDITPVVRVRFNSEEHVKWVLDAGAGGVIIPGLANSDEGKWAVEICKYHPVGRRGFAPTRVGQFWTNHEEYIASANDEIALICQVERASAVEDIEAICQIGPIDALWIGPADLAQSLGHVGNPTHPDVQAAIDKVIEAATRHGKPWGLPVPTVEAFEGYVKRGGTAMVLGLDSRMVMDQAQALASGGLEILHREQLRKKTP